MRCNTFLSEDELYRYSRQIRLDEIGKEGQEKIKGSSVVVIGAGALGCPVLQYLTAAGVGTLGIVDNDWIDESNLNRQILYFKKDIGKPKPLVARERLKQINPNVAFKVHFLRLDKQSGKLFMIDTLNFNMCISSFERVQVLSEITELGVYEDLYSCDNNSVNEISADTLKKMLSENSAITVIDLRDREDTEDIGFETIAIPHYDICRKIKNFSSSDAIVFYCRSGNRSINVINYLKRVHNMENLFNLVV